MSRESNSTPPRSHHPETGGQASWRAAENLHHALFAGPEPAPPAPGEVWNVRASNGGQERLVLAVIAATPNQQQVTVIPLTDEDRYATEWDLRLPAQVLGYPVLAQSKLAGTVTLGQLSERLSSLPHQALAALTELAAAVEQGASIPPEHLPVGPWVLDERDERLRVRARDAQALRSYLLPTLEDPLSEWGSFSSIIVHQAAALGLELDRLLDPEWAGKLQTGELDLLSHVPARKIAKLLTQLQIRWSERVRDSLYRLVLDRYRAPEAVHGAVLARRRGRRPPRARPTSASREQSERSAHEYVAAVEKALEEL